MKRNAFTKIFALVLCLMMVIGCLPISALASDWEGGIDKFIDEIEVFENDAYSWTWNADYTEATASVTVPAYTAYIFNDYTVNQTLVFTANGVAVENVTYGSIMMRMPTTWTITNNTAAAATYELKLVVPVGTWDNPADLEIGANVATTSSDLVYFYSWIAPEDGVLTLSFNSFAAGANADIQGQIGTYEYLSDNADGTMEIDVTAGTEYKFAVVVETADYTASEFSIQADFKAAMPTDAKLKFANPALNLESAIGLQNVILKSAYKNYESFYVELVRGGETTILEPMFVASSYTGYDIPVLPIEMTEEVTLTIYGVKNGVTYRGEVWTTSVMATAMGMLETKAADPVANAAVCKTLVDMLNYGAEVQKAFATEYDVLANANLGDYASLGTAGDITINAEEVITGTTGVKIAKRAFNLDARVEIQVLFTNKSVPADTVFRYTIGDAKPVEIPASEFIAYGSYSYVAFSFAPLQFREDVTYGFYNATTGELVSPLTTTSIEANATAKLADEKVGDLVVAMMKYGDSTYAYVNG